MLDSDATGESEKKRGKQKQNERGRKKETTKEKGKGCTLRVSHVLLGANVVHRVLTYTSVVRREWD